MVETPRAPFEPEPGDAQAPGPDGPGGSSVEGGASKDSPAAWEDEPVDFLGLGEELGAGSPQTAPPPASQEALQGETIALDLDALAAEFDAAGYGPEAGGAAGPREPAETLPEQGAREPEGVSEAGPGPARPPGGPDGIPAVSEPPSAVATTPAPPASSEAAAPAAQAEAGRAPSPQSSGPLPGDLLPDGPTGGGEDPAVTDELLLDLEEEVASWLMELDEEDLEDLGAGVDLDRGAAAQDGAPPIEEEPLPTVGASARGGWLLRAALVAAGLVAGAFGSRWLGTALPSGGGGAQPGADLVARRGPEGGPPAAEPAAADEPSGAHPGGPESATAEGSGSSGGSDTTDPRVGAARPAGTETTGGAAGEEPGEPQEALAESRGPQAAGAGPKGGEAAARETLAVQGASAMGARTAQDGPQAGQPAPPQAVGGAQSAVVPRPPADPDLAGADHEALLADLLATRASPGDLDRLARLPWWRREGAAGPLPGAPQHAAGGGRERRSVELSPEDLVVVPRAESPLREAQPSDLAGIWLESGIPFEALDGEDRLLTPNVGPVRARFRTGEVFEGRLYAVGGGQIWLENRSGKMALPAWRIDEIAQLTESAADFTTGEIPAGLPRVRVRAPGGVFYGWLVAQDGDRVTLRIESGGRITLDALSVEPAGDTRVRVVEVLEGETRQASAQKP